MTGEPGLVAAARAAGVTDQAVLAALREVPRAAFVPAEHAGGAGADRPIPIPHGQVTTQPSLSARMVQALGLTGRERVLEIGSGHGYQSALLARLAARVVSVERWPDLAERARRNLAAYGCTNVTVVVGDGTEGVPGEAPYDAVLVSAAFPEVPPPLVEQLRPGGRLVQPIGSGGFDAVTLFERQASGAGGLVRLARVSPAAFVPLYGRHGYREN
jgi:protein-L-isoaspartate(D-aspartate) O-methyltransferase